MPSRIEIQVQTVDLHGLRQALHSERRSPGRFAEPERQLNTRYFPREQSRRNLG